MCRVINFNSAILSSGVRLYGCYPPAMTGPPIVTLPIPPPPPPLPPPPSVPPSSQQIQPVGFSGVEGAFLSFRITEQEVINRYTISTCVTHTIVYECVPITFCSFSIIIEFTTSSSHGPLVFMQDNNFLTDFLALQLSSGHLIFSYNLGSGSAILESRLEYNDGLLHRVSSRYTLSHTHTR